MRISDFGIMELSGLEFHAYHGCLESEKKEGNRFIVDFKAVYKVRRPAKTDDIQDAADYSVIYELIRKEMETPSELLEHVASRILNAVRDQFSHALPLIKVTVTKCQPPVGGPCEGAKVTVFSDNPIFWLRNSFPIL